MSANPYGASCGTSIVVAPSVAKVNSGKIGTRGARLSDTKSGKAPKRVRTKEELESMQAHPAGKALTKRDEALEHSEGCKCYCTVVKREDAELLDLLASISELADIAGAMVHEYVQQNIKDEGGVMPDDYLKLKTIDESIKDHLRLVGDNDA